VIDRTKRRRFEAQTADEVLAVIGGGGQ